jgi:uncharacterized protein (DUF1330 family)
VRTIEVSEDELESIISRIPAGTPITMLNLLKFNEYANYEQSMGIAKCSGKEAYFNNYLVPAKPLLAAAGGRNTYQGGVAATVIGPTSEQWDVMMLITYPSIEAFIGMVSAAPYLELRKHRRAALEDSRLIAMTETKLDEN